MFFRKNLVVLFRPVGHPKFIQFRCSEAYQRRNNEVSGVSRRNIEIHWEDHDILIVWQLKLITAQRSWVVVDLVQFPMMQCNVSLSIARVDYQKFGFASLPKKAVSRNKEFWDKLLLYLNLRWCDAFPAFSHDVIRSFSEQEIVNCESHPWILAGHYMGTFTDPHSTIVSWGSVHCDLLLHPTKTKYEIEECWWAHHSFVSL